MFSLLLAQSVCKNEMTLSTYKINGKPYLIPDGRLKLFHHIIRKLADGEAQVLDDAPEQPKQNGQANDLDSLIKWISGRGSAFFSDRRKVTWASESEQEQNIGVGIAGGAIVTPFGSVGIVFPIIYPAQDGTQQTVYLRLIETEDGTIVLPSYHADTFDNFQNKLAQGAVQQIALD